MPAGHEDTGIAAAFGALGFRGVLREGVEIIGVAEEAGFEVEGVGAGVDSGGVEVERKGEVVVNARIGREGLREEPFRRQERQIIVGLLWAIDTVSRRNCELELKKFGCGTGAGL